MSDCDQEGEAMKSAMKTAVDFLDPLLDRYHEPLTAPQLADLLRAYGEQVREEDAETARRCPNVDEVDCIKVATAIRKKELP